METRERYGDTSTSNCISAQWLREVGLQGNFGCHVIAFASRTGRIQSELHVIAARRAIVGHEVA